jgi:hypothetical protein
MPILNTDLLSFNDVSILIRGATEQTPVSMAPTVIYNATDTVIVLTKSDMNKIYIINNNADVTINLPDCLQTDLGLWVIIHKAGAGNLSVYASTDTKIEDSGVGSYVINTSSTQTWANIGVFLAKIDLWKFIGAPLGTWTTI